MSLIDYALSHEHEFYPAKSEVYDDSLPIITIHMDAYYGLPYLKEAVNSVYDQTYPNVELVLVDNGALSDVSSYIRATFNSNKNTSLIVFNENIFDWNDCNITAAVCWNVALMKCNGEYLSHLAYDDMISSNYAEKMVGLFRENKNCETAAPLPWRVNEKGEFFMDRTPFGDLRLSNQRGRYTEGKKIADSLLNSENLFAAPGEIFCHKVESLKAYGGYDRCWDVNQVFKYAIHGLSGYDPDAILMWRCHEGQLNRQLATKGIFDSSKRGRTQVEESGVLDIWRNKYGASEAKRLDEYFLNYHSDQHESTLSNNVLGFKYVAAFNTLKNIYREKSLRVVLRSLLVMVHQFIISVFRFVINIPRLLFSKMLNKKQREIIKSYVHKFRSSG